VELHFCVVQSKAVNMKPMTLKQAVAKVCKRMKRHEWFVLDWCIRTDDGAGDCPLTCETLHGCWGYKRAARTLRITGAHAEAIADAADGRTRTSLRRALLAAAGLPDDTKPAKSRVVEVQPRRKGRR
jgi:hypothetical protein